MSEYRFGDHVEPVPLRQPIHPELEAQIRAAVAAGMTPDEVAESFGEDIAEAYYSNPYNVEGRDPFNAA